MTFRPLPLVVVLVAAADLAGTCGCLRHETRGEDPIPKAVRLVAVESSTGAAAATYSAVIAPNAQVALAFRVTGYVVDIRQFKGPDGRLRALEPGALIARGVTLGRIRPADYQAVVDKAHGARDEATTGIDSATAVRAEAQAGLTEAELDFTRVDVLWRQDSVTKPAYDGARAKLDAARAKVDAATAGVAAARQRATAAAAQAREAEIALGDTELRAPFDAILIQRHVDIGTLVSPAMPAFTVADLRTVKAGFNVPDSALHLFHPGQRLPLTVDAFAADRFEGNVLSVAPAADPKARSFEITIAIDNPGLKLRSGLIASIQVASEPARASQLRIPIDALVHDPARDRYLVYTVEQRDGRTVAKPVYVRPGPLVGNQIAILEGLTAGQRIVASGANLLRAGDAVKEMD